MRGVSEDFGTLEVFGIPFSTFTRTITLGLEELGLGQFYIQHETPPHSREVLQHNPFGLLPVLVHRPDALYTRNEDLIVLYESNAIRRYIDEWIAPIAARKLGKTVRLTPGYSAEAGGDGVGRHAGGSSADGDTIRVAAARAQMDQWVSIASSILFPAAELGVIKPRLAMESNGADDASIGIGIEDGIHRLHQKLDIFEKELGAHAGGPFLCGKSLTWADLFLYPVMADLRAVPEVRV